MKEFFEFFNRFGIFFDDSAPLEAKIYFYFLILSVFLLMNVVNIIIYLLSIYIINHEKFLKLIPVRYTIIHRLIKYYTQIRIYFIILESVFLLVCLAIMISVSYGLVYLYIDYR